ncbi:hypothetical protein KIW84_012320 [Lathyrus oleraceus]|uniref:Uncharacterized protein n=1 Tax=Pisum sativum TaxID=3888 RepID=A0A9D5GWJ9_PEA|nr:hypothetical protein KIW84_012320 [Pisum sativum]
MHIQEFPPTRSCLDYFIHVQEVFPEVLLEVLCPLPTLSTSSNLMLEDGITFDARLLDADALKSVINYCMDGTLIKQGCNRNLKAREISSKVDDSERSMQIDSASNDVSQPVLKARLLDFAVSLLPGLDVKDIDLLFEVLEPALQDVGVMQKKAYKRY